MLVNILKIEIIRSDSSFKIFFRYDLKKFNDSKWTERSRISDFIVVIQIHRAEYFPLVNSWRRLRIQRMSLLKMHLLVLFESAYLQACTVVHHYLGQWTRSNVCVLVWAFHVFHVGLDARARKDTSLVRFDGHCKCLVGSSSCTVFGLHELALFCQLGRDFPIEDFHVVVFESVAQSVL